MSLLFPFFFPLSTSFHLVPVEAWSRFGSDNPPPVTITGVAPWAVQSRPAGSVAAVSSSSSSSSSSSTPSTLHHHLSSGATLAEGKEGLADGEERLGGFELMQAYIDRCVPPSRPLTEAERAQQQAEDWNNQQAAATPTLLPDLKFHDLVFGAVLGEGAFSIVKYARRINRVRLG